MDADFFLRVAARRVASEPRFRALAIVCALLLSGLAIRLGAGSLASVTPNGASAGVTIAITGTGFNTTASKNQVTFTVTGSAPVTATAVSIATIDPTAGLRRIQLPVPAGLPAGAAAISVKNTATGEISQGKTLDVLVLQLPAIASAARGASNVKVRITGSPNSKFVAGTRATFGADVTVASTTVVSATAVDAVISVPAAAALGPRTVTVITSTQTAQLIDGFSVTPVNHPPIANPGGPYSGTAGLAVTFDGTGSTDSDGDQLTYSWTFGDGSSGTGAKPSHAYASAGTYTVTLSVDDGHGGAHQASTAAQIAPANQPPVARAGGPYSGTATQPVALDGSASSDPDGNSLTYLWTFGDGTTGTGQKPTHTYATAGSFTITLVVNDGRVDSAPSTATATIVLANRPPTAHAGGPYSGVAGQAVAFDATHSTDPDADQLTFTWDFGDGAQGSGATPSHVYARDGTFNGSVTVTDGHGGSSQAAFSAAIAAASLGRGIVAGRVLDDVTGMPIGNAHARLVSVDGVAADLPAVDTDALGRFRLSSATGRARIDVARDGYTSGVRFIQVVDSKRVDPLDVRLTPLDSRVAVIPAATGGTATSSGANARIIVPAGSLAGDASIRITELSAQSLIAPLPLGWSPVAAVEITPGTLVLGSAAQLRLAGTFAPTATAVVAAWDAAQGAWIGAGTPTRGDQQIDAAIQRSGQIAIVVGDAAPDSPAIPAPGQPLSGVAPRAPPDVQVSMTPAPRILFAQPGARSRVTASVVPGAPLPSGTPIDVEGAETFALADGGVLAPVPQHRLFTLYQTGAGATLRSAFSVTPSRTFAPFALRQGTVDLAARLPGSPFAAHGRVVSPAGGEADGPSGERLAIASGSSSTDVPVDIEMVSATQLGLALPAGFSLLGALSLDFHGARLSLPATLSIPAPAGAAVGANGVLVRAIDVGTSTRLLLVASAIVQGDRLVSSIDPFGDASVTLPGVRDEGRYAFLLSASPLGYLAGLVNGDAGSALTGALVLPQPGIGATTGTDGRYVVAGRVGPADLTITNLATGDVVHATAQFTATAGAQPDVGVGAAAPVVTAIAPAAGAVGVPLATTVVVTFSRTIDVASVGADAVRVDSTAGRVAGSFSLAPDGRSGTFRPGALLASATGYTIAIGAGIRDTAGRSLVPPGISSFTTIDTTPPPPPPAGAITATIPDASGTTIVSGTQGSAEPGGLVLVRNLRTGALTTLTPHADGSFSGVIAALRSDRLELILKDAAGNSSTVAVAPFRNADGSVVFGAAGGHLDGPNGITLDVPAGALPDGTVVKLTAVAESQLPLQAPSEYPFLAGLRLDLGGVKAAKELKLAVPAPADATSTEQILVAAPIALASGPAWTLVERAHLSAGKYVTASPPFPGVTGQGTYSFLRPEGSCISFVSMLAEFSGLPVVIQALTDPFAYLASVQTVVLAKRCESPLQIQARDFDTAAVIAQIDARTPAAPGEIVALPGVLTNDHISPIVIDVTTFNGQQAGQIEVRFSESMDADAVRAHFVVVDSRGHAVDGQVELSLGNTVAVFHPTVPFRLGEQYTVRLDGVTDMAGNAAHSDPAAFTPFDPEGTDPFPLTRFGTVPGLSDALTKCANGTCSTQVRDTAAIGNVLFLANGLGNDAERYQVFPPQRLIAVDVSKATAPVRIGFSSTPGNPRALAAVAGARFTRPDGNPFAGNLVLAASGGRILDNIELPGRLDVLDATGCVVPPTLPNCLDESIQPRRAITFLSTPTGESPRPGVPVEAGVPQQLAVLHQKGTTGADDIIAAYVVVSGAGLEAVDVTKVVGVPASGATTAGPSGFIRGDFLDVGIVKNQVVAVEHNPATGQATLDLFSAQLTNKRPIALPGPAARVAVIENMLVDLDRDGRVGTAEEEDQDPVGHELTARDELFDLALVTSGQSPSCPSGSLVPCGELAIVDLSALTDLNHRTDRGVIERITLPGAAFSLQIDPEALLAYVEVRGKGLVIVDLTHLRTTLQSGVSGPAFVDSNADGIDDRVLAVVDKPDIFSGQIHVDTARGVAFINGTATGMTVMKISDRCNELSADFRSTEDAPSLEAAATGKENRGTRLLEEKNILFPMLNQAATVLVNAGISDMALLEQGSGACFWRAPLPGQFPPNTRPEVVLSVLCSSFQPGTSDHDIEVFVPQNRVESAQSLLDSFLDAENGNPESPIHQIGRLTLFAVSKEAFEGGELLNGTPRNRSGDPAGDLAMGRQLLLLLWILEGEYIPGLEGKSLDQLLQELKAIPGGPGNPIVPGEPSAIPRLEGYEWSALQELNFYKTGALLRIAGACNGTSQAFSVGEHVLPPDETNDRTANFDDGDFLTRDCQDQIHTIAKSAIRTTLARLAEDEAANPEILDITRTAYRTNACLTGVSDVRNPPATPAGYTEKACGSFEEFIASVAIKSVQSGFTVFQPSDLPAIFTFYCAKVGEHCATRDGRLIGGPLFTTDAETNRFVSDALAFIETSKGLTATTYLDTLEKDTKPIGPLPFLSEISTLCQSLTGVALSTSSPRNAVRICNDEIVRHKLDGDPSVQPADPQDGGPPKPVELAERKERRTFLEKRYGVRNVLITNLRVRATNLGVRTVTGVPMTLYTGDGMQQPSYESIKRYPIDALGPASSRILDVADKKPIFPMVFSLSALQPRAPGALAFFLDPERRVPENDKRDNQAAFFYYKLDRNDATPPNLPQAPASAIPDTSPDPLCAACPAFDLHLTAHPAQDFTSGGSEDVTVQIGQEIELDYRAVNRGNTPLTNLTIRRAGSDGIVLGPIDLPAASAAPEGRRQIERFTPDGLGTFFVVANATAHDATGNTIDAEAARVRINVLPPPCDAIIGSLQPDPNPVDEFGLPVSPIMQGGALLRYYKVVDGTTGAPVRNTQVGIFITQLPGGAPTRVTATTDDKGFIVHTVANPVTDNPLGLMLPTTMLGTDVSDYEVRLDEVAGYSRVCKQKFIARVKPFQFTESLKAGAAIDVGGKIEFGVGLEAGSGLELSLAGHLDRHQAGDQRVFDRLSVGRSQQIKGTVKFAPNLGEMGVGFIGKAGIAGPGLDLSASQTVNIGDRFAFPPGLPLSDESKAQVFALATSQLQGSPIVGMIRRRVTPVVGPVDSLLASESIGVTLGASGELKLFDVFLGLDRASYQSGTKVFSLAAAASAGISATVNAENKIPEHEVAVSARASGQGDATLGLAFGMQKAEEKAAASPDPTKPPTAKVAKEMTSILDLLKTAAEAGVSEGAGVKWTLDKDNSFLPKRLDFFIDTKKTYGIQVFGQEVIEGGDGGQITRTYSVSGGSQILEAMENVSDLPGLVGTLFTAKYHTEPSMFAGPSKFHEDLIAFLDAVIADAQVSEDIRSGDGASFRVGIRGSLLGAGVNAGVSLKVDHALGHARLKGVLKAGDSYRLEDYTTVESPAFDEFGLIAALKDMGPIVGDVLLSALHPVQRQPSDTGGGMIKSSGSAELRTSSDIDFAAIEDLLSYDFDPIAGPVQPVRYAPDAVAGAAGKPHYGIGGFHDFAPRDVTLSTPATLAIDYHANEVAGIDEASLRIYRWNQDRRDWDLIGGTVDLATRIVTAQITRLGSYTLAPAMPAGEVTWTVDSVDVTSAGSPAAHTRVRFSSSAVGTNAGGQASGTLFHVFSGAAVSFDSTGMVLFGTPITSDLAPDLSGVQVTLGPDGRLHVEYDYPGQPMFVRLLTFSDVGTAAGEQVLSVVRP